MTNEPATVIKKRYLAPSTVIGCVHSNADYIAREMATHEKKNAPTPPHLDYHRGELEQYDAEHGGKRTRAARHRSQQGARLPVEVVRERQLLKVHEDVEGDAALHLGGDLTKNKMSISLLWGTDGVAHATMFGAIGTTPP